MVQRLSKWASVMEEEKINKLSEYIYVDRDVLRQLVNIGVTIEKVDELRGILKLNTLPGYDITNVLDYYDEVVVAICLELIKTHYDIIGDELEKAELDALGVSEVPEVPVPEGVTPEEVLEEGVTEEPTITPKIEEKPVIKTWSRKGKGVASWGKKRGQTTMSKQETFVFSRRDMKPKELSLTFNEQFGTSRTPSSISAKKYRLSKKYTPMGTLK